MHGEIVKLNVGDYGYNMLQLTSEQITHNKTINKNVVCVQACVCVCVCVCVCECVYIVFACVCM